MWAKPIIMERRTTEHTTGRISIVLIKFFIRELQIQLFYTIFNA